MMRGASLMLAVLVLAAVAAAGCLTASPAHAATPRAAGACSLPGFVRAPGDRPCPPSRPVLVGRARSNILGVSIGKILGKITGTVLKSLGLATIVAWVVDGAAAALRFTASLISSSTRPNLQSTWFSASYWRVAAVAALLTLPFLFAAAIHALVRSDLGLLARAAFGYLPLALLGVGVAAPLTMLVVSATDEMSAFVAAASGHADSAFLGHASLAVTAGSIVGKDPFIAFFAGLLTVAATMALWIELLVRDAAVYVIVLMLPLFFAAMVWPARRVWAIRAVETLFALILSKFAIVSVLALGGAALAHTSTDGPATLVLGATLVLLATFCPWALLRLLPLHEVAAAAAGSLSQGPRALVGQTARLATAESDTLRTADDTGSVPRMALAHDRRGGPGERASAARGESGSDAAALLPAGGGPSAERIRDATAGSPDGGPADTSPADGSATSPQQDPPEQPAGVSSAPAAQTSASAADTRARPAGEDPAELGTSTADGDDEIARDQRPPLRRAQFDTGVYPGIALGEPEIPEGAVGLVPGPGGEDPAPDSGPASMPAPAPAHERDRAPAPEPVPLPEVDPPPALGDEDYLG